jgi:hypothetical protein
MILSLAPSSTQASGLRTLLLFISILHVSNFRLSLIGGLATALLATSSHLAYLLLYLVNIPGNPRVKMTDPDPDPDIPVPEKDGSGFFQVWVRGLMGLTGMYDPTCVEVWASHL